MEMRGFILICKLKKGGLFTEILKQKFGYITYKIGNEHYIQRINWKDDQMSRSDKNHEEQDKNKS